VVLFCAKNSANMASSTRFSIRFNDNPAVTYFLGPPCHIAIGYDKQRWSDMRLAAYPTCRVQSIESINARTYLLAHAD